MNSRTPTRLLWTTGCHDGKVAVDDSDKFQGGLCDSPEEVLRSIEADWIMGEGDPDMILSLSAIESFARVIYELLRGDTTWDAPRLRRLRTIVAKHLQAVLRKPKREEVHTMEMGKPLRLGEAVRKLRESMNMSVRTLASKSGFSPSFISQVENEQTSPSIASLERIAAALGVTLAQFFQSTELHAPAIIKGTKRRALTSGWSRARLELLGPVGVGSVLEPVMITIAPGGASIKAPVTNGSHQFAVVFDGEVNLTLEDKQERLERGDAVTIPPGTPHRWHNTTSEPTQILIVSAPLTR